jgi:hypothetical protein
MGYHINSGPFAGRHSGCEDINLSPVGGTLTSASGETIYGSAIELGGPHGCRLTLAVTSVSAADSLDCTIQGSETGVFGGEERTLATFTQNTGASTQSLSFIGARFIRPSFVLTGTTVTVAATLKGERCC